MNHKVYKTIISVAKQGLLKEPFSSDDFRKNCPGLGDGTYKAFLYKHRKGNKGGNSVLFEKVGTNLFKIIHPYKYGF